LRFFAALLAAKTVRLGIKIFGKMLHLNGSHFPGNVACRIDPLFLQHITKPKTVITVTGTNGKTTTCNMIIDALEASGQEVLSNRAGSNILGGIATTLLSGVNIFNRTKYDMAVLELDEKSSYRIYPYVKPTYAVVTNLFRDSLKRNAHSEFIFDIINRNMPDETTLILNADDLISNRMKQDGPNKKVFFGIDRMPTDRTESVNIVNDARTCPNCNAMVKYEFVRYHHIGRAICPKCGYKSPKADYLVENVDFEKGTMVFVGKDGKKTEMKLASDSIFNLYNEVAAAALLGELGISGEDTKKAFSNLEVTKARYLKEELGGVTVINHLAKGQNPVACSIVFDYVKNEPGEKEVVLLIEDYHDNRESSENVAWLYDCDFEFLNDPSITKIAAGGYRAEDMKLRLLLAGVPEEKIIARKKEEEIPDLLSLKKGETVYVLYDMYEQPVVDKVNAGLRRLLKGGEEA